MKIASMYTYQHAQDSGCFSCAVVFISSFYYAYAGLKRPILIQLSENSSSAELQFLMRKNFIFFEGTKNDPTIITLLPLNHRMDCRCDWEY